LVVWGSLIGIGFGLGDLVAVGTRAGASILKTFGAAPLEATSPVLTVSAGLGGKNFFKNKLMI